MKAVVVVPTLAADDALAGCLASLSRQTYRDFEVIVVDNSGAGRARAPGARLISCPRNVGYGAAINLGIRESTAPFVAALNDDAEPEPAWLGALIYAMEKDEQVGMCASQVLLAGDGPPRIDSAGMLLSPDGTSKQRGHREDPTGYGCGGEALFPSGSAALYRRAMIEETGGFDESFFLYCEDSDLGLRAHWMGWRCVYVPEAKVRHRYSHSAGRASSLKAYYVERNRLFLAAKNFPAAMLVRTPFYSAMRYWQHLALKEGAAAEFRKQGSAWRLAWIVLKAHLALLVHWPRLLRDRRRLRARARISPMEFQALARRFSISVKEAARQ